MFVAIQEISSQVISREAPTWNLWRQRIVSGLLLGLAIVTCRRLDFTTNASSESQDSSELSLYESANIHDRSIDQAYGGCYVTIHPIEDGFW